MTFLYIWSGFAGLLCVLFVLKLLLQIGLAGSGHYVDWSSYNAMLLGSADCGVLSSHGARRLS